MRERMKINKKGAGFGTFKKDDMRSRHNKVLTILRNFLSQRKKFIKIAASQRKNFFCLKLFSDEI